MRFSFALIVFGGLLLSVVYANGDYSTVSGSSSVVELSYTTLSSNPQNAINATEKRMPYLA